MTTSIDDLIQPISEDVVLERWLASLETMGLRARSWRAGGVARSILRVVSSSYAGFTTLMAQFIRGGFLETAEGAWLTRLAQYVYNVTRIPATFATGYVTLTNAGGSHGPFLADTIRVKNTNAGKVYVVSEAFSLAPSEVRTVAVRAVEAGAASSAVAGAIDALETTLIGVTCANATDVVGSDEESDSDLRRRCLAKLAAISVRGPRGAYAYAVTSSVRDDGSPVDVNRYAISPSSSTGVVTVYVASPSGPPVSSDLDIIADNIEAIARPDCVTVNVLAATSLAVTKIITVWVRRTDGVSAADISTLVQKALTTAIRSYPIGGIPQPPSSQGYLYEKYLAGVIYSAHPSIFDIDGLGGDTALTPDQVATLSATISVRIVEVQAA